MAHPRPIPSRAPTRSAWLKGSARLVLALAGVASFAAEQPWTVKNKTNHWIVLQMAAGDDGKGGLGTLDPDTRADVKLDFGIKRSLTFKSAVGFDLTPYLDKGKINGTFTLWSPTAPSFKVTVSRNGAGQVQCNGVQVNYLDSQKGIWTMVDHTLTLEDPNSRAQ